MEKPPKSKNKFLKFLPKVAYSAVTFHNPNLPFSPKSDAKPHIGKALSIIPAEARRKPKNSSFEAQEPTSPKVSCMGQIKHRHQKQIKRENKHKHVSLPKDFKPSSNKIPNMLEKQPGRKSDVTKSTIIDRAPGLSQIRGFKSGRDSLAGFDWTAQIAPVEGDQDEESEGEEKEIIIPFSAPILVSAGEGVELEPKKEINLWKRRTMSQPRPLQVDTL